DLQLDRNRRTLRRSEPDHALRASAVSEICPRWSSRTGLGRGWWANHALSFQSKFRLFGFGLCTRDGAHLPRQVSEPGIQGWRCFGLNRHWLAFLRCCCRGIQCSRLRYWLRQASELLAGVLSRLEAG